MNHPIGIEPDEAEQLERWVHEHGVRTVLEFGPGVSTEVFRHCGCVVTSLEEQEQYLRTPMIHVPFRQRVQEIVGLDTAYDFGFVDGPCGYNRKLARLTSALHCYDRCRRIALHDTHRPDEKFIVEILLRLGCTVVEQSESARGLTLLSGPGKNT